MYRLDGTVPLSPVWHEWRDGGFRVVTAGRDVKYAERAAGDLLIRLEPGDLRAWDSADEPT